MRVHITYRPYTIFVDVDVFTAPTIIFEVCRVVVILWSATEYPRKGMLPDHIIKRCRTTIGLLHRTNTSYGRARYVLLPLYTFLDVDTQQHPCCDSNAHTDYSNLTKTVMYSTYCKLYTCLLRCFKICCV